MRPCYMLHKHWGESKQWMVVIPDTSGSEIGRELVVRARVRKSELITLVSLITVICSLLPHLLRAPTSPTHIFQVVSEHLMVPSGVGLRTSSVPQDSTHSPSWKHT